MSRMGNPVDVLKEPEVTKYFLSILNGDLPAIEKYNKFIKFFQVRSQIKKKVYGDSEYKNIKNRKEADLLVSNVCKQMGYWKPKKILEQTADCIIRAVRRLKASQHQDGGWGDVIEQSNFWSTSFAVLCLYSALDMEDIPFVENIDKMIRDGMLWLLRYPHRWFVEYIPPEGDLSIYDISIAISCLNQANKRGFKCRSSGDTQISPEDAVSIGIDRICASQNEDGGWDARIWGNAKPTLTRVYSEVGATSMALQVLAEVNREKLGIDVEKALQWLVGTQNHDGSWNNGSCYPGSGEYNLSGDATINKTCDALQGIIAAQELGSDIESLKKHILNAVDWLKDREQPLFDKERNIKGWGWGPSDLDYENTCLTLETLVKIPEISLPLLTSNAQWLIKNQIKKDGCIQDGNWKYGHTARITISLIEYFNTIKKSALFE